jgi:hypothetical protein
MHFQRHKLGGGNRHGVFLSIVATAPVHSMQRQSGSKLTNDSSRKLMRCSVIIRTDDMNFSSLRAMRWVPSGSSITNPVSAVFQPITLRTGTNMPGVGIYCHMNTFIAGMENCGDWT